MPDSLIINHTERPVFPKTVWEKAWNHSYLSEALTQLEMQHDCVRVMGIGESILGRTIYAVTLGNPDAPGVLYAGGTEARDSQSPAALLRFIGDYADFLERGKRMYGVSMSYLHTSRCITVIPLLNPDGCAIVRKTAEPVHQNGILPENWTGNGRGADLMTDFETFCREPETCAVTGFVRTMRNTELCFGLHPAENGISYDPSAKRAVPVGRLLSRMIGCEVRKTGCGMARWFTGETGKPAYTCGAAEDGDYISLYAALREALFSMPLLI